MSRWVYNVDTRRQIENATNIIFSWPLRLWFIWVEDQPFSFYALEGGRKSKVTKAIRCRPLPRGGDGLWPRTTTSDQQAEQGACLWMPTSTSWNLMKNCSFRPVLDQPDMSTWLAHDFNWISLLNWSLHARTRAWWRIRLLKAIASGSEVRLKSSVAHGFLDNRDITWKLIVGCSKLVVVTYWIVNLVAKSV